jgi:fumarate reductase (CoM/CoB) subunit A
VDEWGAAPLAGLYACGETAGGTHGGNRLNSNAVPETQVFGHRAGEAAAAFAAARARPGRTDDGVSAAWARRLTEVRSDSPDVSSESKARLAAFRQAMWLGLGIVRTAEGLRQALDEAAVVRARAAAALPETLGELVAAVELEQLAATAHACAASAALRTESRAAHYREDFPRPDPGWLCTVVYREGRAERRPLARDAGEDGHLEPATAPAARADEFVE